ncbi:MULTISPECIES: Rap1a/Tai family immunity protein [unclassified Tatumella]|uniref:Rap1a/Tai family immunity protein n=1 Tax=unclassified Tatumella TaxID=2649542 RepID=UPI001BAEBCBA|nr:MULTISPECIES: Rap1a/Tai family immunity protein [unclassified Tatumella]MBS0857230.1 hypothetical protein [Tatumella sp. JGM16]MBS0913983.1 hypothetical protein [Tatumella sp. JGM91]
MIRKIFAIILLIVPVASFADFRALQTGNDLLYDIQQGKAGDNAASFYTTGYLRGISDFQIMIGLLCPPQGADMSQFTDIVQGFLMNNPTIRNETSSLLSSAALGQAFPCKKK